MVTLLKEAPDPKSQGQQIEEEFKDPEEINLPDMKLEKLAQRHDWRKILRDLVKKEDMDPWDVQISRLVGEYIQTIKEMKKLDFRVPANALLASSILLREKSGSWVLKEEEEEEEENIWDMMPSTPDQIPPPREEIPEPKPKKRETKKKVSVDELIEAVDEVIKKEKKKAKEKVKEGKTKTPEQNLVPDQLLELAKNKEDDFEEKIEETEGKVKANLDEEGLTTFTDLLEDEEESLELIDIFVSLLHLANKRKISIWQEEVFGEIFIHYIGEED